eukprot:scaffold2901_cov99-Skeletonema_marinoi.AAC.4
MSSSRASSLSPSKSQSSGDWWREAAQSFSPSKITSGTNDNDDNNYGSIAPPSYVTSPIRHNPFNEGMTANTMSLQDHTATSTRDSYDDDDIFGNDTNNILQPREGTLSDISNDSSDSESDDDYSSYASDDSDHSLERPHRTVGLIFFDTLRLVAISANVRFFNTEMVPVLMAWKTMDILNKCLRIFMGSSSILLITLEFPEFFPFLQHNPLSQPTPPLYVSNWIPRGIFYLFLALVMFEQQVVVAFIDVKRHASTSSRFFDGIFMVISAAIMILVGMTYILLGMFCVQKIMERVRREEMERWDEYWEKLKKLEEEEDLEEEREWLLENGGELGQGDGKSIRSGAAAIGFKERWRKWRKRFKRRYRRGRGWWRSIDFKC